MLRKTITFLLPLMALTYCGCGDSGSTSTIPTCQLGTANVANSQTLQEYLFLYQPNFQWGDTDYTSGNGTYACSNTGGTYVVSNVAGTDTNNYSMTYTLNNCVSPASSPYPMALTGSYTFSKSSSANSHTIKITPITQLQAFKPSTYTQQAWTLLPGGYKTVTNNSSGKTVDFVNWTLQSSTQSLTGNFTLHDVSSSGQSYTQTILANSTLTSSAGWTLIFQTTTPITRTWGNFFPDAINSGTIGINGSNNSSSSISYSYQNANINYSISACPESANGTFTAF
ncbi:MAG: hypothetical protein RL154_1465 [Pseudomonadota bacterium]|jgi:hypothetical protein